jgi:GTP-binding protein
VLLLVDASLPPKELDLAGVQWLLERKYPLTLVFTKCDKSKKGGPGPVDNIAGFRAQLDSLKLLQPAQFPTCAVGSSSFGRQALLSYLARRVAGHTGAAQPAVFAAAAAAGPGS